MKILYIHQYFNTPANNGGTRSFEFARRLVARGHEVHVVTTLRQSEDLPRKWQVTNEFGINVHWFPINYSNNKNFFGRIFAFTFFVIVACFRVSQLKCDLVFATSTPLTAAIPGIVAKKLHRVPMVFEVRDVWPKVPIALGILKNPIFIYLAQWLEKIAYRNADAIVALSPDMKRDIIATCLSPDKIAVIPNSCDLEVFQNKNLSKEVPGLPIFSDPNAKYLIYTGTLGKVNGLTYLIRLAYELRKIGSNVKVVLIGDGREKEALIQLAIHLDVYCTHVFFYDAVPKSEIPIYLKNCHMGSNIILDIPELCANSANKFFDTIAGGKPILINHDGWMKDVIDFHQIGIVTAGLSSVQAAQLVDLKLNDEEWCKQTSKRAFSVASNFFDREKHAQQLCNLFQKVRDGQAHLASTIADGNFLKEFLE